MITTKKAFLVLLLSITFCAASRATTETHIWALGQWPNRYGLIGVSEGAREAYTLIEYGSGVDSIAVPLHIYWVVVIVSALTVVCIGLGLYLSRRYLRRYGSAASSETITNC